MMFYLLQSSAQAKFDINPSTIPAANLFIIAITSLLAIAMVLFVIVRYVKKIGPIDLAKEHTTQSVVYNMNRENQELDEQLRIKIRMITSTLKTRLNNIFYESKVCTVALIALSNVVRNPLYTAANNNHFTTALLPENRENYINGLLRAVEDEYVAVYNAIAGVRCEKEKNIPQWEDDENDKNSMKKRIRAFLLEWANEVVTEVIKTCIKKIEVYEKYKPDFRNDVYRLEIVDNCIAKNKNYVSQLDRHGNVNWK